jgi:EmrB/QacA subfamily drug resistance transporter
MEDASSKERPLVDKRTRRAIMIGLALGMLMACLDGTIISTAIKTIIEDFNGYTEYSWVITGFMLCETIMIPLGGKLSDQYGRKPVFMAGIAIFLAGSILSGLSQNMTQLIAFRAIQGLGGGILIPVATASVADLYSPSERGKMQGALGSLFAVAMCVGPFLGGFITDHISWHWIFFINVPIGAVALVFVLKKFPKPVIEGVVRVDYLGMGVLSAFILDLLLFFTWVGVDFEWASVETAAMMAVAAGLLALLIKIEFRAADPVIRPGLFRNRMFICCALTMLIFGLAMMGCMTYIAIFMQAVIGISATNTGTIMLPMVAGLMITSMVSGFSASRTGYRPWLIAGPIISALGMYLLSTLAAGSDTTIAILYLFITGLGLGCVMSIVMIATQNSSKPGEMGMTTSAVNLFRSIGSTVAVGVFTTIVNGRIASELAAHLPEGWIGIIPNTTGAMNYLTSPDIPDMVKGVILDAYSSGVTFSFFCAAVVVLCLLAMAVFMKGKPARETKASPTAADPPEDGADGF